MPREVTKAKIACLSFNLQKAKMNLGVQVVINDPEKLDAIRQRWVEVCVYVDLNCTSCVGDSVKNVRFWVDLI